ncbi:amidohydrolase family protein [Maricaulis sp. CAU 1757]
MWPNILALGLGLAIGAGMAAADDALSCPPDTVETARFSELTSGTRRGDRVACEAADGSLVYRMRSGRFAWTREERLVLGEDGLPLDIDIEGSLAPGLDWREFYRRSGSRVSWGTPLARADREVDGPTYYVPAYPAHDPGILVRALLHNDGAPITLLPGGEARLRLVATHTLSDGQDPRGITVRLFAIDGLRLSPTHVWLDGNSDTFAAEWMIRSGWEAHFPALRAAMTEDSMAFLRDRSATLVPPSAPSQLLVRNIRLLDTRTGALQAGMSLLIEGERIVEIGPASTLEPPEGATIIDGAGRVAMPGLWDMHGHVTIPRASRPAEELPLFLASGVTTIRDLSPETGLLVRLRDAVADGEVIGPRIIGAGLIDGAGGEDDGVGTLVADETGLRAAVRHYAGLGFRQIKTYNDFPPALVPALVEETRAHGLRLSGHVPFEMSPVAAMEAGYDELQHLYYLLDPDRSNADLIAAGEDWTSYFVHLASLQRGHPDRIRLRDALLEHGVTVDTTLMLFADFESPPGFLSATIDRVPEPVAHVMRGRTLCQSCPVPHNPFSQTAARQIAANLFDLTAELHEAGVPILIGTDQPYAWGLLREEMAAHVEAGLAPAEVIRVATLGAAEAMGMEADFGTLEVGKMADILLVNGDPTRDIQALGRIAAVIQGGRVHDSAAIFRSYSIDP